MTFRSGSEPPDVQAEKQELVVRAAKGLRIKDIALFEARFERPIRDSGEVTGDVVQQHKRGVQFAVGAVPAEYPEGTRLLQVRVSLGTRVVQSPDDEDPKPLFIIEADYLVEYVMTDDIPEDALKAFAEFNAVHNVWPFWREHVFNIVGRGRLPKLEVPLFQGALV